MATRRSKDPIKEITRETKAQRLVGESAACACGEKRPEALVARRKPPICYQCSRLADGGNPFEAHHVAGKRNRPVTLAVPANDHRAILSVEQYGWPKATLENPEHSPLLAAAATLRGLSDTIIYLVTIFIEWIVLMLESLDAWLREEHGPHYWRDMPIAQWEPS
jgi:hypothetical protein